MSRPPTRARGFTLVEVTLAIGIAVFCLAVVFGLLTVGVNTSSASVEQTVAATFLSAIAGDLHAAPNPFPKGSAQTTPLYQLKIPAAATVASATPQTLYLGTDGQPTASANAPGTRYQLNVWMTPGTGRNATVARLLLTWPPGATLAATSGGAGKPDYNAGSVETIVALDRN